MIRQNVAICLILPVTGRVLLAFFRLCDNNIRQNDERAKMKPEGKVLFVSERRQPLSRKTA